MAENGSRKRSRSPKDEEGSDSSDDDFGPAPALPSTTAPKKKRKLAYESLYVNALPKGTRYSKSLMHKDQLSTVTVAPSPADFIITASVDGVVKFWKKVATGIEFAKEYQAHEGRVLSSAVSQDGGLFASSGDEDDTTIKLFDVITFDLLSILNLDQPASCLCWVHRKGAAPLLAASVGKTIRIYDGRGGNDKPVHVLSNLHRGEVVAMAYNPAYDCVVSADASGMLEYWQPNGNYEKPDNVFEMKSKTNLFDFKKAKSVPCALAISPSGHQLATLSFPDRKIRVFDFPSAKLHRSYDESIDTLTTMQQAGTAAIKLENVEFGRRMATEQALDTAAVRSRISITFDESSNFLLYGSLHGIKVINTLTNRVMRIYGRDEPFRALSIALYQGAPSRKELTTVEMAASANPLLEEAQERDPILFATGYGKVRFYMFSNDESPSKSSRDIYNEKPKTTASNTSKQEKKVETGTSAILHTNMGDIYLRLFPQQAPLAVENFLTHARTGYYNNTIFHRVIRKFMIQGGDPLGDGTGGESIWGKEFKDEITDLKHDKPFTLSMANAGPNTNASQFFITTAEKAEWLDGKHTVFGRVWKGMEVVMAIEGVKTVKERPEVDIKIVNIEVGS
jgi:peptidylprolyl isomerase domain and WD repeat-containing protein 1